MNTYKCIYKTLVELYPKPPYSISIFFQLNQTYEAMLTFFYII